MKHLIIRISKKLNINIPNILTIFRIIVIPFFALSILNKFYTYAIILFTVAGISDVLDGYLARKYDIVSEFGKVADPIADKLMQFTAVLTLTINGAIEPIIIIIIGIKELLMGIGTIFLFKRLHTFNAANWYGKITTFLIYTAVILILFDVGFGKYILYLSIVMTVFSFVMYGLLTKKVINKS